MVFADATGTVTRVHANAVPGDLTPNDGGDGVQYVLEINGGLAEKLGITPAPCCAIPPSPPKALPGPAAKGKPSQLLYPD